MKARYVLNRRSLILHRLPTIESCNVDAVPRAQRRYFASTKAAADFYDRFCSHCLEHQRRKKRV